MANIGFIGLGIMGRPMAKNLISAGHKLVVYDKFAKFDDLVSLGAEGAVRSGGLGEAIASLVLGEVNAKFEMVAINDVFGTSAHGYEELLVDYGLSTNHVYKAVIKALKPIK